ncbi:MAG: zinc finger domain-containing protein [Moraxella osloensis]
MVKPATGEKCIRCWHIREDIGINPAHPEICGRQCRECRRSRRGVIMPNTQVTTAATHSSTTPPINGNKAMMRVWYCGFGNDYRPTPPSCTLSTTTSCIKPRRLLSRFLTLLLVTSNYGAAFSFLADKGVAGKNGCLADWHWLFPCVSWRIHANFNKPNYWLWACHW